MYSPSVERLHRSVYPSFHAQSPPVANHWQAQVADSKRRQVSTRGSISNYIPSYYFSIEYVKKVTSRLPVGALRLSSPVESIKTISVDGKSKVILRTTTGHVEEYDHVILACHSGTSLKILENGGMVAPEEKSILSGFKWTWNPTVLHSDVSVSLSPLIWLLAMSSMIRLLNGMHCLTGTPKEEESMVLLELRYAFGASDKR
jgi:hypothetical protein